MNSRQPSKKIWQTTRRQLTKVAGGLTSSGGEQAPVKEEWNGQGWPSAEALSSGNRRHMTRVSKGPVTQLSLTFHTPESWRVPLRRKAILTTLVSTSPAKVIYRALGQPPSRNAYATL